jgi:hypothetical protein
LLNEIETHPTNFRFVAFSWKMKNNFFLLFNDFDEKIAFLGEIKKMTLVKKTLITIFESVEIKHNFWSFEHSLLILVIYLVL